METSSPIGFFDSGVGGLTIWKEVYQLLPFEDTIYIADSANAPYGEKTQQEIIHLSKKNTGFLIQQGVKLIVVACNTATTMAISTLRKEFDIPFIGIEPAFKPAALKSKAKKVGVLATKGTLNSTLFNETYRRFGRDIDTTIRVGKGLVELIENGKKDTLEMRELISEYITPMVEHGVDHIVLGCTHYPFLRDLIQEITPNHVEIIDSGEAVARQTLKTLNSHHILNNTKQPSQHQFYTNGKMDVLEKLLLDCEGENYSINTYKP